MKDGIYLKRYSCTKDIFLEVFNGNTCECLWFIHARSSKSLYTFFHHPFPLVELIFAHFSQYEMMNSSIAQEFAFEKVQEMAFTTLNLCFAQGNVL